MESFSQAFEDAEIEFIYFTENSSFLILFVLAHLVFYIVFKIMQKTCCNWWCPFKCVYFKIGIHKYFCYNGLISLFMGCSFEITLTAAINLFFSNQWTSGSWSEIFSVVFAAISLFAMASILLILIIKCWKNRKDLANQRF